MSSLIDLRPESSVSTVSFCETHVSGHVRSVAQAFGSMEEALDGIGIEAPDVALVDIGLPGMSGIEGVRRLK